MAIIYGVMIHCLKNKHIIYFYSHLSSIMWQIRCEDIEVKKMACLLKLLIDKLNLLICHMSYFPGNYIFMSVIKFLKKTLFTFKCTIVCY